MPDSTLRELPLRVFCAVALLLVAAPVEADVARRAASDFHLRAQVEGDRMPGEAVAISLSGEAVSAIDSGRELRVFDADGREIPSVIETAKARREVIGRPASIFNRAWTDDGTQTFSVELTERVALPVNEFVVTIDDDDYHLLTRVEGSDDGETWKTVGDRLHLIRHSVTNERIDYVHDVLRLPPARFRYYRFTLTPRLPLEDASQPLEVSSVEVREVVLRGSALDVATTIESFDDPQDDDPRHHYFRLDLTHEGLGVDRVSLTIPADDYARPASLWEWSDERGRRTRRLARTVVFQYGDDVHTQFEGFTTRASRLVVMLDQGDDEPVPVTGARASRPLQQVRFLAPDSVKAPIALYFEPDDAQQPRYDLARLLREREISSFRELSHGRLDANPGYEEPPPPRSEQVPYLLYLLVVPLVAVLVWYVARTIRRALPDETSPSDP